ncbi:hypothetical protein [Sphingomonas sp. SORGH_AS_0879]|uniref:hypothetical protein n=1 Tax=Sphingomonas sp. SORGH_AS_0879 TaxID=3041790 RepID=UPI00278B1219|nr:hypothetical protein [Sphingomonas sp. SORGH_AS_0879]MDQ1232267.1 hypothetical protein [Sphingomonas sp. SORGH_AS_0879]
MPRLSEIGDNEAIDNRYARKVIVYVESEADATIFYGLTEPGIREFLEFKPPTSLSRGADAVIEEVRLRRPQYRRTFGLIDGEEAAGYGAIDVLLECRTTIFRLQEAEEGLIFLGQHEIENVLILHGGLAELIRRDRSILSSAELSDGEIAERVATVVRQFFQAALLKYASMTYNHLVNKVTPKSGCKVIDSARFLRSAPRGAVLGEIKASVEAEGIVAWDDLMREVKRTWRLVRREFIDTRPDSARCGLERMRLTDGKSVVARLAALSSSDSGKWSNHLLETAKTSDYADRFRAELLEFTGAA